jgi:uncharacterized tellurite resistance protein B-like protein
MSILGKLLGLDAGGPESSGSGVGDTETVRRIARQLRSLPADRARYLGAFAYVLGRVADADLDISDEESSAMERIVERVGGVPPEQAVLVVEIAKSQNRLFGGTESYLVTRELRAISTPEQRAQILDCLFEVSAADDAITATEENLVWQVASELGFTRAEYLAVRSRWSEKRTVLRRDPER